MSAAYHLSRTAGEGGPIAQRWEGEVSPWRALTRRRLCPEAPSPAVRGRESLRHIQGGGEVAGLFPHPGKRLQIETTGDQLQDRGGVVAGVVDDTALGERRHDHRRDARPGPEAIAPTRPRWRRHMVPEAAIL